MEKFFSRIEKVLIAFSISEKIIPKIDSLMYALRAHINRTHNRFQYKRIKIIISNGTNPQANHTKVQILAFHLAQTHKHTQITMQHKSKPLTTIVNSNMYGTTNRDREGDTRFGLAIGEHHHPM